MNIVDVRYEQNVIYSSILDFYSHCLKQFRLHEFKFFCRIPLNANSFPATACLRASSEKGEHALKRAIQKKYKEQRNSKKENQHIFIYIWLRAKCLVESGVEGCVKLLQTSNRKNSTTKTTNLRKA